MGQLEDCLKAAKSEKIQEKCFDTFSAKPGDDGHLRTTQSPAQAAAARQTCAEATIAYDRAVQEKGGINSPGEFFGRVAGRLGELGSAAADAAAGVRPERLKPFNRDSYTADELKEIDALAAAKDAACQKDKRR